MNTGRFSKTCKPFFSLKHKHTQDTTEGTYKN